MTITQYKVEFIALSRYTLEMVTLEARKVSKFEKGLRLEIRHTMVGIRADDFPTVVRHAHAI